MISSKDYKFNIEKGEFLLENYETGKDWCNQLWNDIGYMSTITHTGCITSKYVNEKNEQISLDCPKANFVYLRDEDSKKYWNIGEFPANNGVENFKCKHTQNSSEISCDFENCHSSIEFRLEPKAKREVWKVILKNNSTKDKNLSVFGMMAFDMNGYAQPVYYSSITTSATEFIKDANGIFCNMQNPYSPFEDDCGYIISSEEVFAYDGNLEKFLGTCGTHTKPLIIEKGLDCSNSLATVRTRCGVLQNKITLKQGEEKTLYFVLGFIDTSKNLIKNYDEYIASAKNLFQTESESGFILRTKSPSDRINRIMNYWTQKQVSYCCIGKKAVRDNAQLVVGLLNFDTKKAKKVLVECLEHQYSDGRAVLTYYPYLEPNTYSDPAFWLVYATTEYIKETGDFDFLNQSFNYLDCGDASVLEHLKKAMAWYLAKENYGKNGLPRIHHADWNDALNIPDDNAESVFMGMAICYGLKELANLCYKINEENYAKELLAHYESLKITINKVAFNGDYYIRAISKFGIVGDKNDNNGGNIYVNPQTWSILSEVVEPINLQKILDSIDKMETNEGIPLCSPAYKKYDKSVGRMSGMLPGVYENGGIYNHAGCFKVMADCKLKRTENALNTLLKIIPDGEFNPSNITTTEPYVFTNCYLKHSSVDMQVGFSWQTGTSAWGLRCYYEGILGLKRSYDGLEISPCIPKDWKEVSATRLYRGNILDITFFNNGGDKVSIEVDGVAIRGNILPIFSDNMKHQIKVVLN